MKKIAVLMLSAALAISLAACGGKSDGGAVFNPNPAVNAGNGSSAVTALRQSGPQLDEPERLKPKADGKNDPISTAALIGAWNIINVSGGTWLTNYSGSSGGNIFSFHADGTFMKAELMQFTSSYASYGAYYNYYNTYSTGAYQFQTQGKWRVKGGVIELYDAATSSKSGRDWNDLNAKPDGPWKPTPDCSYEFEFLDAMRLRLRDNSDGQDTNTIYGWDGDSHNVNLPPHEIPPVKWPERALSAEMPVYGGAGRVRETRLRGYAEDDADAPEEIYRTVYITIDREEEAGVDSYLGELKRAGWYVDEEWRQARKGFYTVDVSFSEPDELEIESTRAVEGVWPGGWAEAGIATPKNAPVVGEIDVSDWEKAENLSLSVEFDKTDEAGAEAYLQTLAGGGYILIDDGWTREVYNYLRLDGLLYRVSVSKEETYGEITEMYYYLRYYEDGIWPDIWSKAGLNPPVGAEIAGAIDLSDWGPDEDGWFNGSYYAELLGVDAAGLSAYFDSLERQGFIPVENEYSDAREVYKYMRVDGGMYKVSVADEQGEELACVSYRFTYYQDGNWPDIWKSAGLNPPEIGQIAGAIDLSDWGPDEDNWFSETYCVEFTGLDPAGLGNYLDGLERQGFAATENEWQEAREVYNCLRIDGHMYKVTVTDDQQDPELAEIGYSFEYYPDGVWPASKIPPDIIPPDGAQLLGEIEVDEDWGSFTFSCWPMDETAVRAYMRKLQSNGWTISEWDGTQSEKTVNWRGGRYECSIGLSGVTDGLGDFYVSFPKDE
jgi:hypothetical protein